MTDEQHYIVPESLLKAALYEVNFLIEHTEEKPNDPLDDHAFDVESALEEYVDRGVRMDL